LALLAVGVAAAALGLLAVGVAAGALGLLATGALGLLAVGVGAGALGLPGAASDLTVRLLLRRSGRVVGSEPRTLGGGVSLITPVSPGA
jgi:hypothetical protein